MVFRSFHTDNGSYGITTKKMVLRNCHKKRFQEACQTEKLMIFGSLPHRNWVLGGMLAINNIIFRRLLQRKCLLGDCYKENVFYEVATLKMFFRGLPYGKWFLGGYHKENAF